MNDNYDLYDEIHIPFIPEYHYGMSFIEVVQKYPKLIHKLRVHSLHNQEELDLIRYRQFKLGELIEP